MAYRYTSDRSQLGAFHVFNRARDGIWLFRDDEDRAQFEWMIARHLSPAGHSDRRGRPYTCLADEVSLNALNLLTTHFHNVLRQKRHGGIEHLMGRVLAAYTRYYHRKYGTSGPLFAGPYRARRIESPNSFKWRMAYVHDNNKRDGPCSKYSTHRYYLEPATAPDWVDTRSALRVFGGERAYVEYMEEYAKRKSLDRALRL